MDGGMTMENSDGLFDTLCDPYLYDTSLYSKTLSSDASRLFVDEGETKVELLEIAQHSELQYLGDESLENCLTGLRGGGTRVFFVGQQGSWGRLTISHASFRKLFTRFAVFPPMLDIVEAFGRRNGATRSNDMMGCFHTQSHGGNRLSEYSYLLKYIEKHGRAHLSDPWSIRQTAVYHRCDHQNNDHTFIVLNPSTSSVKRLLRAKAGASSLPSWADIHTLIASCASAQWRTYLNDLEEKLDSLKAKAYNSDILSDDEQMGSFAFLQYTDVQDLEVLHDKLLRITHILATNLSALRDLSHALGQHFPTTQRHVNLDNVHEDERLQICATSIALQKQRAETIIRRLNAVGQLMQSLISVRALGALQSTGRTSTRLMKLAQTDSNRMLDLSEKAHYDSRSLKTITILTLVYLPASFASQLLSMGYISLNRSRQPESLQFAGEFWIFVVLTVILLFVTIGAWLFLEYRRAKRRAHHSEDAASSFEEKV